MTEDLLEGSKFFLSTLGKPSVLGTSEMDNRVPLIRFEALATPRVAMENGRTASKEWKPR